MEEKVGEVAYARAGPGYLEVEAKGKPSQGDPVARLEGRPYPGKVEGPQVGIVVNEGKVIPGQETVMEAGPIDP